jgi:excinuclease ABC subunit C
VEQFVLQFYGQDDAVIPREVLVPELPDDHEALAELLTEIRGSRVSLRVPQRGDKRSLMQTVQRNAEQAFLQFKLRRASDLTARSQALAELQEALDMPDAPLRIECFDISHVQGTNVVASMVVFEDGLARKSEYRRFAMRESGGDTDWIAEVIRRRFARYLHETAQTGEPVAGQAAGDQAAGRPAPLTEDGRPKKFAYPPNLVVVDGGAPQVAAAQAVLTDLGIPDVTLVGLAKRLEEVWLPGEDHPIILPRSSEALYLLQRVRDEAHRFAITFHRQKRSKSMTASELTGIAGLGPARRKALLARFGSLR